MSLKYLRTDIKTWKIDRGPKCSVGGWKILWMRWTVAPQWLPWSLTIQLERYESNEFSERLLITCYTGLQNVVEGLSNRRLLWSQLHNTNKVREFLWVYLLLSITSCLDYLDEWNRTATKAGYEFITENSYGLKVSLRATLEISNFLGGKCEFNYLITARLNQDSLEVEFHSGCETNDEKCLTNSFHIYFL